MIGDRTRSIIIGVVTVIWAVNFFAGLLMPNYHPSETINGIFMAIVGGLFALSSREREQQGDDTKDNDKISKG